VSQAQNTSPSSSGEAILPLSSVAPSAVEQAPEQAGRCLATTKAGAPCRGTATGDGFCPWHSPATNATLKRAWRSKGGRTRQRAALVEERAQIAATLPSDVELPPTPAVVGSGAPDWSDAKKIRLYLQQLAVKVATGTITVSVAEMLRKLADSTLKVVDAELDAELVAQLGGEDEE
jgi:hypothetical protein